MQMKEFVLQMTSFINKVIQNPEHLVNDEPDKLISLESQRFIFELKNLLESYVTCEREMSESTLGAFIDLLKKREELILGTDAVYSHNISSHANIISLKIADYLAKTTKRPAFQFLFSNLRMSSLAFGNRNEEDKYAKKVNRMELSDDNTQLIDVLMCLENAHARLATNGKIKELTLRYTNGAKSAEAELTENEKSRVIHFNVLTEKYYQSILSGSHRKLTKAHNKLSKKVGFQTNTVSYGAVGKALLKERLYGDIEKLTREELIQKLEKYPHNLRERYLANIPCERLHAILCEGNQKLSVVVSRQSIYTGQESYDSALIYAFVYLYSMELDNRKEEYLGLFGSYVGSYAGGFSKTQKQQGVKIPKLFLEQDGKLNEYEEYLNRSEFDNIRNTLQSSFLIPDTLTTISNQIIKLSKLAYISEIQKSHTQLKSCRVNSGL